MLVSAVIPTFNRAKDVVLAIESVLAQTYKPIEILVCDDGSKDDTAEVITRTYGDRVRYLPKPNGGVSSARNWGIERATGEVIAFLDSDDEWLPTKIEKQMAILAARPKVGLVLAGIVEIDGTRTPTGRTTTRRDDYPRDGAILPDVVRCPKMCPSTAIVRTAIARQVGGFDITLRTAEDLDFFLRAARLCEIAVVAEPLILYSRADGSLGSEMRTYRDHVFVMERFLGEFAHELSPEDVRDGLLSTYLANARGLAYYGDVKTAAQLSMKSLRLLRRRTEVTALAKISAMMARELYRGAQRSLSRISGRSKIA